MSRTHQIRPRPSTLAGTAVALLLTACATGAPAGGSSSEGSLPGFPIAVVNCGTEVTFDEPPERVVTIKSSTTELMLALGLDDRIVATAFQDGPVPDRWSEAASDIKVLSDVAPSQEAVLETGPDLVFAGWESNLTADTAGERDTLAKLGVATYVAPSACRSEGQPESMTYELLFSHFEELAQIFGVSEAADSLVAEQRAQLDQVPQANEGTTALWWSSASDTPYVGGGIGAPQMVMDAVGLENVAGDTEKAWTSMGWESIVAADPDVLVLVDADWNSADSKIEALESNPATAEMTAVKKQRYVRVAFPAAEAGVRSVPAAKHIAGQLNGIGLIAGDAGGEDATER